MWCVVFFLWPNIFARNIDRKREGENWILGDLSKGMCHLFTQAMQSSKKNHESIFGESTKKICLIITLNF